MTAKELKIFLVCMKYGYGDPNRGTSYEWNHFYLGIKDIFKETHFFDYMECCQCDGKQNMQSKLLREVQEKKPDIILFCLYTDQFDSEFVNSLKQYANTFCFFHDDSWRQDFAKYWAPNFDAFNTTDPNGIVKYQCMGFKNVVFMPFGVNENLFQSVHVHKDIDVSFVGEWHPYRQWLLNRLKKAGIKVQVYGNNWPSGAISTEMMVEIFQRSKISLNLSNSLSYDIRYLLSSPHAILNTLRTKKNYEQLKGRHLEIPACGTMQLSYYVEGLERLFKIGEEISIFNSPDELVERVQYFLQRDALRERIAKAGYQRTLLDHTYSKRFTDAFKQLGWIQHD